MRAVENLIYYKMGFKLILVMYLLNLIQFLNCKIYRIHLNENLLPHNEKTVPSCWDYFSREHFILEQIDDNNVQIGGYLECIKSMDRNLPIQLHIRTQFYENARWNEGAYQLTSPNACFEFVNPERLWYNTTKLWDSKVCPSQIGDQWTVETNQMNVLIDLPPTIKIAPWKVYVLASQGVPGFETHKYGFGFEMEFLPVK